GGDCCTRITRVRRSAVVARRGLEATTLLSVASGAGGRELLPRCYQTIPNHADPRRTASVPSVEIFEPYIVVGLRGNPLGILLISGSTVRVLDGPPSSFLPPVCYHVPRRAHSRPPCCPSAATCRRCRRSAESTRLDSPAHRFSRVETYRSLSGRRRFETK